MIGTAVRNGDDHLRPRFGGVFFRIGRPELVVGTSRQIGSLSSHILQKALGPPAGAAAGARGCSCACSAGASGDPRRLTTSEGAELHLVVAQAGVKGALKSAMPSTPKVAASPSKNVVATRQEAHALSPG
jgi:hypothetical protein